MTRTRGPVRGGYVRKTVSLPSRLATDLEKHLRKNEGLTMSALVTAAAEEYMKMVRSGMI